MLAGKYHYSVIRQASLFQSGLKLAIARGAVNRYYEAYSRDAQVWAVVSALRHDRYHREVQAAERSWSPHSLWLLDLGMLTAACGVMFLVAYARELMLFREFLDNRALMGLTVVTLLVEIVPPLWLDRGHGTGDGHRWRLGAARP